MKWMKWVLVLAVGVVVALGAVGCGGDDDEGDGGDGGSGNSLVGTWKATTYNGQAIPANISVVMTFHSNGSISATATVNGETSSAEGTWSSGNGILTVTYDGDTESTPYSISGNTLTVNYGDYTIGLARQ